MTAVPILQASARTDASPDIQQLGRVAGFALWAVAVVFLVGTAIDFGILWGLQREAQPQWEFVALSSTAEGMARPILAIGLLFLGTAVAGINKRAWTVSLSTVTVLIGLAGLAIALLIGSDYVALAPQVEGEQLARLRSVALKGAALGALYSVVLIPLGIFGLRKPKKKKKHPAREGG